MQILIASDRDDAARRAAEMISASGLEQSAVVTVSLERAAERVGRFLPDLALLVLPPMRPAGWRPCRNSARRCRNSTSWSPDRPAIPS